MKKSGIFLMAALLFTLAGCSSDPGNTSKPITINFDKVNITNVTTQIISNSINSIVDTNATQALIGEWLVIFETYLVYTNVYSNNGDIITNYEVMATNTYGSIASNGNGGAYSYRFNADGTVDNIIYDDTGNPTNTEIANYIYQVVTNQYGSSLELIIPGSVSEMRWWEPEGERGISDDPVTYSCWVTNYSMNYKILQVYQTNFDTYMPVTKVESWVLYVNKSMDIESYAFSLDTNRMTVNLDPDTVYQSTITRNNGPKRSIRTQVETSTVNNGSISTTTSISFEPEVDVHYVLKKIR